MLDAWPLPYWHEPIAVAPPDDKDDAPETGPNGDYVVGCLK